MPAPRWPSGIHSHVVLAEELALLPLPHPVGEGVAPAIEEVARGTRGLLGRRAVVDDPDLVVAPDAERDLIELGVVVDPVGVHPVGVLHARLARGVLRVLLLLFFLVVGVVIVVVASRVAERGHLLLELFFLRLVGRIGVAVAVDVDPLRAVGGMRVVRQRGIAVLDHVVERVPGPHDLTALGARRPDLVHRAGPELLALEQLGIASGGERHVARRAVPSDQQDVPVRQLLDVVVVEPVLAVPAEVPQHVAVPVELLDPAPVPAGVLEDRVVPYFLALQQRPALGQVDGDAGRGLRLPSVDRRPGHVDQVHVLRLERRDQGEARPRGVRLPPVA